MRRKFAPLTSVNIQHSSNDWIAKAIENVIKKERLTISPMGAIAI